MDQTQLSYKSLIEGSNQVSANSISQNTKKNYDKMLRRYQTIVLLIPNFPPAYPLTEGEIRAFLEYYRITYPKTTIGYLRQFIAGFSYYLR